MNKPPVTADDYIAAAMQELRADLRERTIFGPAGRAVVRYSGERRIVAPDGTPIKIIELPEGGNQIETDHSLHAHVRPQPIRLRLTTH